MAEARAGCRARAVCAGCCLSVVEEERAALCNRASHSDLLRPVACVPCPAQVKDYISAIVTRRNSITSVLYRDDPAIFSWNLLNEPRCKYCGPEVVDSWFGEIAAHLKVSE